MHSLTRATRFASSYFHRSEYIWMANSILEFRQYSFSASMNFPS